MDERTLLIELYKDSYSLVKNQLDGINDTEALIQPSWGGNCINWIAGHLVVARCNLLIMLGSPSVWDMNTCRKYIPGSPPIRDCKGAEKMVKIASALEATQENLIIDLGIVSKESLQVILEDKPLIEHLHLYNNHESFHAGQLDVLKQMLRGGDRKG